MKNAIRTSLSDFDVALMMAKRFLEEFDPSLRHSYAELRILHILGACGIESQLHICRIYFKGGRRLELDALCVADQLMDIHGPGSWSDIITRLLNKVKDPGYGGLQRCAFFPQSATQVNSQLDQLIARCPEIADWITSETTYLQTLLLSQRSPSCLHAPSKVRL